MSTRNAAVDYLIINHGLDAVEARLLAYHVWDLAGRGKDEPVDMVTLDSVVEEMVKAK